VKLIEAEADLVVLATGMVPNAVDDDLALFTRKDEEGFVLDDLDSRVTVAGVARRPEDVASSVRDATGAAARAVIAAGGRA
jgi:quinone-modifying oxidoreductase subunit QmoA